MSREEFIDLFLDTMENKQKEIHNFESDLINTYNAVAHIPDKCFDPFNPVIGSKSELTRELVITLEESFFNELVNAIADELKRRGIIKE